MYKAIHAAMISTAFISSTFGADHAGHYNNPPAYGQQFSIVSPITPLYAQQQLAHTPAYLSAKETTAKLKELKALMETKDFQVWNAIQLLLDLNSCHPEKAAEVKKDIISNFPPNFDYTLLYCPGESQAQKLVRFAYLVIAREKITDWVLNNTIWAFDNYSSWENVRRGKPLSITPAQRLDLWDTILRHYPSMNNVNLRNLKEFAERLLKEFEYAHGCDKNSAVKSSEGLESKEPSTPIAPLYFRYNFQEKINPILRYLNEIFQPQQSSLPW